MKNRILALLTALTLLLTLLVGCTGGTPVTSDPDTTAKDPVPQLTVAMNPIFVYDDGEAVIAYNDIKNAMKADCEGASLTAMYNNTGWQWAYGEADTWTLRATHGLSRWQNGAGVTAKKTNAYAFNADSSISVMTYSAMSLELATYDGAAVPEYGLLLSVSGSEQEGLCYTVQKDGILNIPAGTVTAVEAVASVNTGFLAEDGTQRQAAVTITVNSRPVWSGTLCNSTAGDGTAVTTLNYPQITDIPVTAGDCVIISVKLDAEANRVEDIATPEEERPNDSTVSDGGSNVDVDNTPNTSTGAEDSEPEKTEPIPLITDYASTFTLVRAENADTDVMQLAIDMRTRLEQILDAEVLLRNDSQQENEYEIVLGKAEGRPEAVALYNDLVEARANNADDYVIRRVGTKVYIVATNATTLQKAVDAFLATYCPDDTAEIPAELNVVHREKKSTVLIGNANVASYTIRTQRYPSYWEVTAAEDLRDHMIAKTGYTLKIVSGGTATAHDIQLGPQNTGVRAIWNSDETRFVGVQDSGYLDAAYGDYTIALKGGVLAVNGGSSHAVNAGVQTLLEILDKQSALPVGYTASGTYAEDYSLSGGYGLTWAEEFDYDEGSDVANERAVKSRWYISSDTTPGPTVLGEDAAGNTLWDEQHRPGIYGENYWVKDGLLWEITKWAPYGYDAVRLTTQNKMYFTFGVLEVRMVAGTRNGACSSVWMAFDGLGHVLGPEIDVYENFGRDGFIHAALTWTDEAHGGNRSHFGMGTGNETWVWPEEGEHYYDTFHYIGLRWTADTVAYYIDGRCTYSHDITDSEYDALRNGQVLKLANGVGTKGYSSNRDENGDSGDNPADCLDDVTQFYETQLVDYVRVYQLDDKDHVLRTR